MFQQIIKETIMMLKKLTERMESAYHETYNDLELTREANKAIDNMRRKNKKEFIHYILMKQEVVD